MALEPYSRKPEKVAAWVAAGKGPPDAGHIKAFLEARGVVFGADGPSVLADGTIVIAGTDATVQKLRPALDAIEPATLDPVAAKRAAALAALVPILAEIRGRPLSARTPAEEAVLLFAVLQGLDEAEAIGSPDALAAQIDAVAPGQPVKGVKA